MLLVNLTVSDILMAVTGFPLLIVCSIKGKWSFPHWGMFLAFTPGGVVKFKYEF